MNSLTAVSGSFRPVLFDAITHYREPEAAFFRYLAPEVAESLRIHHGLVATNPAEGDLPSYLEFGGDDRRNGAMTQSRVRPSVPTPYWCRDARLKMMDDQGVERAWFFPTLATTWEERLQSDPDASVQLFTAFNRWLDDDWGFAYQDRVYAAPYISLADPRRAVDMLRWCLDHDARVVMIRPALASTRNGLLRPTDPHYDELWALAQEAGITVAVHASKAGYLRHGHPLVDPSHGVPPTEQLIWSYLHAERPVFDFLAAVLVDRLFERFPGLRLASVESGSRYLPDLISKVTTVRDNHPTHFADDPVDLLRERVWFVPHWDEDINEMIDLIGAGHVLFGSGWPLPGGPESPAEYVGEVAHLPRQNQTAILHGNADLLNQRMPMSVRSA